MYVCRYLSHAHEGVEFGPFCIILYGVARSFQDVLSRQVTRDARDLAHGVKVRYDS